MKVGRAGGRVLVHCSGIRVRGGIWWGRKLGESALALGLDWLAVLHRATGGEGWLIVMRRAYIAERMASYRMLMLSPVTAEPPSHDLLPTISNPGLLCPPQSLLSEPV
jgi:hypothetical protein